MANISGFQPEDESSILSTYTNMYIQEGKNKRIAVKLTCAYCGCKFWKAKHRLRKNRKDYYCSTRCAQLSQRNGEKTLCACCGKPIYRAKRDLQRSKHQVFFCSKACQSEAQKILGPEPNCYGKETNDSRTLCSFYYPEIKCSHCGYYEHLPLVEVHHIDSNRENNSPENLIWLCTMCHRAVTLGLAQIEKRKFQWKTARSLSS